MATYTRGLMAEDNTLLFELEDMVEISVGKEKIEWSREILELKRRLSQDFDVIIENDKDRFGFRIHVFRRKTGFSSSEVLRRCERGYDPLAHLKK